MSYLLHIEATYTQWPLLAGIFAAAIHVFTGPDHLAAVMPFAVEHKKSSWKIGLSWGSGHLLGMLLIGLLFAIFKEILPLEIISQYSELLVGFVLIGIGIWAIFRIRNKNSKHQHPHFHKENDEFHIHKHEHTKAPKHNHTNHSHKNKLKNGIWSSLWIGILHGFAGVAHFILFLPMLGFSSAAQSFLYIIGFGIGTIATMIVFTIGIGLLAKKTENKNSVFSLNALSYAAASIAIIIGVYWIFQ